MIATRGFGDGAGIIMCGYGIIERMVVLAKLRIRETLSSILRIVDLESRIT